MVRLDRNTFQKAIKTGKGNALAHVRAYGDNGVQDLILEACITTLVYDRQSEDNRGLWLYEIVKACTNADIYYRTVLDAFKQKHIDDIEQLALLLVGMARDQIGGARDTLYGRFDEDIEARYYLSEYLMLLDGYDGLEHAVNGLGEELALNPDQHENIFFLHYAYERLERDRVLKGLQDSARTHPNIQTYLERVSRCNNGLLPKPTPSIRPPFETLSEFISAIETNPTAVGFMAGRWMSENASDSDAKAVLSAFIRLPDPEAKSRLLKFFLRRPLPYLHSTVFEAALSENPRLRFAAVQALSHSDAPEVRTFALPLIAQGRSIYLRLLGQTYQDGDLSLLTPHLKTFTNEDLIHDVGLDIVNFCKAVPHNDTIETLLWVYDQTPCSQCREFSVDNLKKINALPEAIAREMQDDCTHERFES